MSDNLPPLPQGFTLYRPNLPPVPSGWQLVGPGASQSAPASAPEQGMGEQAARALGLTARAAAPAATGAVIGGALGALGGPAAPLTIPAGAAIGAGIGSIAYPISDLAVSGWNAMTGRQDPLPSASLERNLTRLGVPEPRDGTERIVQAASRGAIDAATGAAAARQGLRLIQSVPGVRPPSTGANVVQTMSEGPGMQTASGAISGGTAQSATELGAPPLLSMALGTGAGFLPGVRPNHLFANNTTGADAASQQRAYLRSLLEREGVPLSPAQQLANPNAGLFESVMKYLPTSGPRVAQQENATQRGFTRAVNRHAGLDADNALPETLDAHQRVLGDRYDALEQATMLTPDNRFAQALQQGRSAWVDGLDTSMRRLFNNQVDRLQQFVNARSQGAVMPGQNYHAIDAELGALAKQHLASDHPQVQQYGRAMTNLRDELQQLMLRSAQRQQSTTLPSPNGSQRLSGQELADAWTDLNRQYANFSRIKEAMGGGMGREKLDTGYLPPNALMQAQRARLGPEAMSRAQDPFTDLVRAGAATLPDPIPNSGTAQRTFVQNMLTRGGTIGSTTQGAAATFLDPLISLGLPALVAQQWHAPRLSTEQLGLLGMRSLQGAMEGAK
jgi:hypothetical protein